MNTFLLTLLITLSSCSLALLTVISPPHLRRTLLYDAAAIWGALAAAALLIR